MSAVTVLLKPFQALAKITVGRLSLQLMPRVQHIFKANINQKYRKNKKAESGAEPESQWPTAAYRHFGNRIAHCLSLTLAQYSHFTAPCTRTQELS